MKVALILICCLLGSLRSSGTRASLASAFFKQTDMITAFFHAMESGNISASLNMPAGITILQLQKAFPDADTSRAVLLSGRNCMLFRFHTAQQQQPIEAWHAQDSLMLIRIWRPALAETNDSIIRFPCKPEEVIADHGNFIYPMAK